MVVLRQRRTQAAPTSGTLPVALSFTFSLGGLTPVAAIFRVTGTTTLGTAVTTSRLGIYVTDGTTHRSIACVDESGPTGPNTDTGHLLDNARGQIPLATMIATPTVVGDIREAEFSFVSFAANTVNVQFESLPATAMQVECEVIYGAGASAKVVDFDGNSTVGLSTTVSGIGFTPNVLRFFSTNDTVAADVFGQQSILHTGYATFVGGVIRQFAHSHFGRDRGSINTRIGGRISSSRCLTHFSVSTTSVITEGPRLELTRVASGEFDLTTRDNAGVLSGFALVVGIGVQRAWCGIPSVIAPSGGGADVSAFPTTSTGTHTVKDPGFEAIDVEVVATALSAVDTTTVSTNAGRYCRGGSDGTTPVVVSYQAEHGASPSNGRSLMASKFLRLLTNAGGDECAADLVLGSALGFGVNVGTATGSPDRIFAFLVLSDETLITPTAVALPLVVPAVARLITVTPAAVSVALVLPAVARLITATPAPVELPLVIPAPARLLTETPASVALALVLPAPARLLTLTPDPVELPLVVPSVVVLATETPAPVALALVIPAPTLILPPSGTVQTPSPVVLALVVAAPTVIVVLLPSPVALALLLAAPSRLLTLHPSPVVLAIVVATPRFGAGLELVLEAEIARTLPLAAEVARELELAAEAPRVLDLVSPLE